MITMSKVVLITGASKGIGLATAEKFLAEGWQVIGTFLDQPIPLTHERLTSFQYDQGNSESVAKLVVEVTKVTPHLDALINNAGVLLDPNDTVADPIKVRQTLEINVVGVIDLTERLLSLMGEGGQIINLNSGHGAFSIPIDDESAAGYRVSKAALNMYTKHLAFRLKSRSIIVSSIRPGWVKTDMGHSIATSAEQPDREPTQAAQDIFNLVVTTTDSGQFWEFGHPREW